MSDVNYKELRPGNILATAKSGIYFECTSEDIVQIEYGSKAKPILITEDILKDLGFFKGKLMSSGYYGYKCGLIELDNDFKMTLFNGRIDDCDTVTYDVPLIYVHNLQNIVFYLTGIELNTQKLLINQLNLKIS